MTQDEKQSPDTPQSRKPFFTGLIDKASATFNYLWNGIWSNPSHSAKVKVVKVANLSVRSFLDSNLQTKSMSLTYSTVLAIVPAFALILAIGRGFGLQDVLEEQLFHSFPAQKQIISLALKFVDSYLKQASSGVFVGVGILFLLWTLISLLSYIESAFNNIWGVKHDRSLYQKITDYIAICLMVPILLICSSGISIFVSATTQDNMHFAFLTPVVNIVLEALPLVFAWLAFSLSFLLFPNTKVQFKYAAISGIVCAVVFQVLQLLFVNGQIYVSKYNAIYGSFAFLPLLLIWLQLSWLILLFGCVLTFSMQNVLAFDYIGNVKEISANYCRKLALVAACVVAEAFRSGEVPPTAAQISERLGIPLRITENIFNKLRSAGLVNFVSLDDDRTGFAPAVETSSLTVGELWRRLDSLGAKDFIPGFDKDCAKTLSRIDTLIDESYSALDKTPLSDIKLS